MRAPRGELIALVDHALLRTQRKVRASTSTMEAGLELEWSMQLKGTNGSCNRMQPLCLIFDLRPASALPLSLGPGFLVWELEDGS